MKTRALTLLSVLVLSVAAHAGPFFSEIIQTGTPLVVTVPSRRVLTVSAVTAQNLTSVNYVKGTASVAVDGGTLNEFRNMTFTGPCTLTFSVSSGTSLVNYSIRSN